MESKQEEKIKKRSAWFKVGKVFAWILASLVFLVVLALILIQTSFVQNFARKKIVSYLHDKLKTRVEIGALRIKFPTTVSLRNIFFEDQAGDTLLYGGRIDVDLSMWRLLKKDVEIKEISLDNMIGKIKRLPGDSVFNFQFIADAFSTEPETPSDKGKDSTSSATFNIDRVLVNHTRIIYKDAIGGNDADLSVSHLDTRIAKFDPAHLFFDIPKISLAGLRGHFYQTEPLAKPSPATVAESPSPSGPYLSLANQEINLEDIRVLYNREPSHLQASVVIGKAQVHPRTLDLNKSLFILKNLSLSNSDIAMETGSPASGEKPAAPPVSQPAPPGIKIAAGDVNITNLSFRYDDRAAPPAPGGLDYSHLGITQLSIHATDLEYTGDTMAASVKSAAMRDQSGFVLNRLATDFSMNPSGVSLRNVHMETPGSEIRQSAVITYPSLESIKQNPGLMGLDLDIRDSKVAVRDVLLFAPQLKEKMSSLSPGAVMYADARITGKVADLAIQKLILRGLGATDIDISGTVRGLPDASKINANLAIRKFRTSGKDILGLVPQKSIPAGITLPATLSASGRIKGNRDDLYTDLAIHTSLGDMKIKGTVVNGTDKEKAAYDLSLEAGGLQLGKLMQNPKLGPLTGNFTLKGRGYDPQTADITFAGDVPSVTLNDYTYHQISAGGMLAGKKYSLHLSVQDPNIRARLVAEGIFTGNYPTLRVKGTVDSIKTLPLHLSAGPLRYHGDLDGDFSSILPDSLAGSLYVTHSILDNNGKRITLDSIEIHAENTPMQSLSLRTDFFSASIQGKYRLTQLGDIFQQSVNPYFSVSGARNEIKTDPYHFSMAASLVDHPALHVLLPELSQLKPVHVNGHFATDSGWNFSLTSPHIVYGSSVMDSANLTVETRKDVLLFNTSLARLKSGSSLSVYATTLKGTLQNNSLHFTLNSRDARSKNKYTLSGKLDHPALHTYAFSLSPDSLLLNYEQWTADANNSIRFSAGDIVARKFNLSRNGQQLTINSAGSGAGQPLQIGFKNFKIVTLTGFVESDSLMVNGLLNGQVTVKNALTDPAFTTDLLVNDLSVYNDTLGNLSAKVNNQVASTYHGDIRLSGRGNDIHILGDYFIKPDDNTYGFVVDVVSLQMKALEGFTKGELKDARGSLYGKIALNGSLQKPNIDGKIQFSNTAFNIRKLNNLFKVDKEAIAIINNRGIELNTFTIRDTGNHTIVVDGAILTPDFLNYTFDLKINARNFQAVNSSQKDNSLFYGKMVFSTHLTVKGTPSHPIIDGNLTVDKNTAFTIVLPQEQPGVEKREGIVRFVDRSATAEDSLFMAPYDSLNASPLRGYDISLNITIDKDAIFNLIVDAANGDLLQLKGTGQLTGGIDASGKITLVGSYEIDQGSYNLSFNFVKRKFNIQKGSRIVWTGEPTTAQINITAIYVARTAPLDLVQNQIADADPNIYKQKLPFEVHLLLQGELLKPQITFDIVLPEEKNYSVAKDIITTVQNKLIQLRQENGEMNKQVFALLLLNRFVGENPFDNSSGGSLDANTFAKQSVSRLLTEQLNQLAAGLIEGVDINFDLATTEDYTTGTKKDRTDLKVGVSKNLLSDRLTVTVGSDFELEGPMQTNQQQNNFAGNISLNYKLSKDGKYMLRAYRKNDYTGAIEGYVVETGLGFVISVDYNKFREIFTTKEQRRKKRDIKKKNRVIDQEQKSKARQEPAATPVP